MRSDKLFSRGKAATQKELELKEKNKKERKRILIICEDAVSVPQYLKCLIAHYNLSFPWVKIIGKECGSAPKSLVEHGKKTPKRRR